MLHIHNNLTKRKEPFQPLDPKRVRMYVCGMTVYDYCHIGHARVLVVFDVVNRYLRRLFGDQHVTYVRNITDIDDKIIKRANENNEPFTALTERFINAMHEDADRLGVMRPDQEPRATLYIDEFIAMVNALVEKGYAYPAANGDVYYDVSKFDTYGQLSGKNVEDLRAGERVAIDEMKSDPLDFALWKAAKPDEPAWDSPWGKGRPGWHIECSAMSMKYLGETLDIHGGGMDLLFPHHENELAQSESATGKPFARYWMHNGLTRIKTKMSGGEYGAEKMSRSIGNVVSARQLIEQHGAELVRYFLLSTHYRRPIEFTD